jgi:enterochelin esterase-like enzyme
MVAGLLVVVSAIALASVWLTTGSGSPLAADPWTTSATVASSVLGRDMPAEVFIPQTSPSSALLILFHGRGGDQRQWMQGTLGDGVHIDALAHRLIGQQRIRPITIVSVSIDDSYGVDSALAADGYAHGPYGTYIENDLLPAVIERWGAGQPVYLGGLSMGGYVALRLAFEQPDHFAGVGALSPAFWVQPPADRAWMYDAAQGGDLLAAADAGVADQTPMFLGYGTTDYDWIQRATTQLSTTLASRGHDIQPSVVSGGHETATWRALAEPMLLRLFGRS